MIQVVFGDITNNCNIRCPFCSEDWKAITHREVVMSIPTFDKLAALGATVDAWSLSCGREPTLHPALGDLLDRLPEEPRNAFITTNLAMRLSPGLLRKLAESRLAWINISVEAMTQDWYEHYRRGANFQDFYANLTALIRYNQMAPEPKPRLKSISMLFKGNQELLPIHLVYLRYLGITENEVRTPYPFTLAQMPKGFADQEVLSQGEVEVALARLASVLPDMGVLNRTDETSFPPMVIFVRSNGDVLYLDGGETKTVNLNDLDDPIEFFKEKPDAAAHL
jgi:organic radical activating enzyme